MTDFSCDYPSWWDRNSWNCREAALILNGICPEKSQRKFEWYDFGYLGIDKSTINEEFSFHCSQSIPLIEALLHRYERDRLVQGHSLSTPLEWVQWVVDEGIQFDTAIWYFLTDTGLIVAPTKNSAVYGYYWHWASLSTWNFNEAINLLCRRTTGKSFWLGDEPKGYSKAEEYLKNAIASKEIKYVEIDVISHIERRFKPYDIINWAERNGYLYPRLLKQLLGYENPKTKIIKRGDKGCHPLFNVFSVVCLKLGQPERMPALKVWKYIHSHSNEFENEIKSVEGTPDGFGNIVFYRNEGSAIDTLQYRSFCNLFSKWKSHHRQNHSD